MDILKWNRNTVQCPIICTGLAGSYYDGSGVEQIALLDEI